MLVEIIRLSIDLGNSMLRVESTGMVQIFVLSPILT